MKTSSVSLLLGVSVLLCGLTVSAGSDKRLTLVIPEDPVMQGSDVTLHCANTNGDFVKAYFYVNETTQQSVPEISFTIRNIQQSHEVLYYCAHDLFGQSNKTWLRVRDPPTTSNIHTTTVYSMSVETGPTAFNIPGPPASVSVFRFLLHVVVFCPYCICTILMASICCSRKSGNKPVVSNQHVEEYDDITADVTTDHDLTAAQSE